MITFVKIIILLVGIAFISFFLLDIIITFTEKNSVEDGIQLKFKDFLKFYYLNSFTWELADYTPYYRRSNQYIIFSLIDTFRYQRFRKYIEKQKRKKREEKMTIDFLKSIQQEINFKYDQIAKNSKNIIKR